MRRFRDIPLQRKLILLILLTSVPVLLVASAALVTYGTVRMRGNMARNVTLLANVMGDNCAAAVAFKDVAVAHQTLLGLRVQPEIVYACLYDAAGRLFTEYATQEFQQAQLMRPLPEVYGARFMEGHLVDVEPIQLGADQVGTICLISNMREFRTRLVNYGLIVAAVLVLALLTSWLLASRLALLVSRPVQKLAALARRITEQGDYSLRAVKESDDEIGALFDGFNEMLAQIEKRDTGMRASEERFRQVTESIHEVFWLTNVSKTDMIYISPGYEQIWGRRRGDLYVAPRSWMDAVHPEDRDWVREGALTNQTSGDYDVEYRIIRPNGEVRWIRDRAFPIRDEHGQIYRIAGIAEDVTERKELEREILEISDREQARIGQDLHDGLCQHLVGTAFACAMLERKLEEQDTGEAHKRSQEIMKLMDDAIGQARSLSRVLYPVKVEAEGLANALDGLAVHISGVFKVVCEAVCPQTVNVADRTAATHLYRIAQEAVTNAIKHGRAKHIQIGLQSRDGRVTLTIRDDGVGFVRPRGRSAGMGLAIMKYRARMIGGKLDIGPAPESGTVVTCTYVQPKPA